MKLDPGTKSLAKSAEIRAVITRADGTKEDLGVVSYWHRNPLRRWAWHINRFFKSCAISRVNSGGLK